MPFGRIVEKLATMGAEGLKIERAQILPIPVDVVNLKPIRCPARLTVVAHHPPRSVKPRLGLDLRAGIRTGQSAKSALLE